VYDIKALGFQTYAMETFQKKLQRKVASAVLYLATDRTTALAEVRA
jgi:hypothetical protein